MELILCKITVITWNIGLSLLPGSPLVGHRVWEVMGDGCCRIVISL
jgi:hypothetical protein